MNDLGSILLVTECRVERGYSTAKCRVELPRSGDQADAVVALDGEIIETRGVAPPAGRIDIFRAHDVRSGGHVHVAEADRTLHERNFQLNGRAGFDLARRKKIDSARADVSRNERYGHAFPGIANSEQTQRQRETGARIVAAFADDTDGMRGHARKTARHRLDGRGLTGKSVAGESQRALGGVVRFTKRHDTESRLAIQNCPHALPPTSAPYFRRPQIDRLNMCERARGVNARLQ